MNKKLVLLALILSITSCTGFKGVISHNDPYKNVVLRKKLEHIEKVEKPRNNDISKMIVVKKEEPKPKPKVESLDNIISVKKPKPKVESLDNIISVKREEPIKPVILTRDIKEILRAIKKDYNLVESNDDIERKTVEGLTRLRKETNKNITPAELLKEIHKVIKETNTKSYTMAISRVLNNWSK
jgi:lipoprotein